MNKYRLYYLKDIGIEDIVDKHIEIATSTITEVANFEEIAVCFGSHPEPIYHVVKEAEKAPRKAVLFHKYQFLIHQLIVLCRASETNSITMHYGVYTDILGKHFGKMIYVLKEMGILTITSYYEIGKASRRISLCDWDIGWEDSINKKVYDYIQQYMDLMGISKKKKSKTKSKPFENLNSVPINDFTAEYNLCLNKLMLIDREGALQFINSQKFNSEHQYHYYLSRIEDFEQNTLSIVNIDKNNRIYHYLTSLPKSLKKFFNIKYQLDISNSHPLLFSLSLIKHYNINNNILNNLYNISYSIFNNNNKYNIHYVGKQLYNILNINNIQDTKHIPYDVLAYLYLTSKGLFWDSFTEMLPRDVVKPTLFREVFYGHSLNARGKEYAKAFVRQYPNVWKVIRKVKKDDRTRLANLLMKYESSLFHQILQECWKRGWKVVNIHDAIIVPQCVENSSVSHSEIEQVMLEVYQAHGLFPTIKVDQFYQPQKSGQDFFEMAITTEQRGVAS